MFRGQRNLEPPIPMIGTLDVKIYQKQKIVILSELKISECGIES